MTDNRQWIKSTLAHEQTDKVPYNFSFSPPARRKVEEHYGGGPIEDILDFPVRMTGMGSIKPLYASPREFGDSIRDEFGVLWSTSDIDRGAPIEYCLSEPDLAGYRFPDPAQESRFEHLEAWCETYGKKSFTIIWVGDLWERATFMRGMENILLDLALHPSFVRGLLRGLADYILQTLGILFARFQFDGIAVSDDYGTQKGLLMSPADWRRFIRPLLAEIYGLAKKHDRVVFHHSCGHVTPIIGDLVDIGLDILHPIQPETMDIRELKQEFGNDLTLCGGIRTQDLAVQGTPEDVREEVKRLKMDMAGGYILEPGITLQADVPLENLVAMIDETTG